MKTKKITESGKTYDVVSCGNGNKAWYLNGERHREDGPAIEYLDGTKRWYLNDIEVTEEEHRKSVERKYKKDHINPSHYKQYHIEVIEMMVKIWGREKVADYCMMNAFKYRMRAGHKDDVSQDLEKEQWYLNKAIELI